MIKKEEKKRRSETYKENQGRAESSSGPGRVRGVGCRRCRELAASVAVRDITETPWKGVRIEQDEWERNHDELCKEA